MTSLSVAKVGGYSVKDIKTKSKIKIANPELDTVQMRYSLTTAKIITTHNRLQINWTRREILKKRQLQCFCNHEREHVRWECMIAVNHNDHYYKCSEMGRITPSQDRQ